MSFVSRIGVIGQKIGMSRIMIESKMKAVTLVKVPVNYLLDKKHKEEYSVIKLGIKEFKKRNNKPQKIEYEKKEVENCTFAKEFRVEFQEAENIEKTLEVNMFEKISHVDISGKSIGKGFAGGMKLWGFKGQCASHGSSLSHRSIGSIGTRDKNWKGKKMPGRMGGNLITVQSLKVAMVSLEDGIIAVCGAVPGKNGSWVSVKKSLKKGNRS